MKQIKNNLTTVNYSNGSSTSRIKYIVIHYTANNGDSALGNTNYFKSTYRGASAHYFVDENSIWRCVQDKDIAWHCGGGLQGSGGHSYYKKCLNSNSIGIEMCSRISNGYYYFKDETIANCIELTKYLMAKYNIPASRVIRHYDVTGKNCPEPFVRDSSKWSNFKNKLINIQSIPGIYTIVNCSKLNVRNGIGTNTNIIGSLYPGNQVIIYEVNSNWGKINYNGQTAWISMNYTSFVSEYKESEHWCKKYLDLLINKGIITDKNTWSKYDEPINKALTVCLLDKITGGLWLSNEDDTSIHWAQPNVISLCGKGIINQPQDWINTLDKNISKALLLALICNVTGGISDLYKNRIPDHWARNCLDTLCDRGIIQTPQSWTDFEAEVSKGLTMAIFCKTFYK